MIQGTSMSAEAKQAVPESPSDHDSSWRLECVHHLGLTVSDIERSIDFYRDVLGRRSTDFFGLRCDSAPLDRYNHVVG